MTFLDHVVDPTGCAGDDMHALFECLDVVGDALATDATMHHNIHVVTERDADLLRLLCQLAGRGEEKHLWGNLFVVLEKIKFVEDAPDCMRFNERNKLSIDHN